MNRLHYSKIPKVPGTNVALLSAPSKMPGMSFGLPAHKSCPRANGSICDSCYAEKGLYQQAAVRNALDVRFHWTVYSLRTQGGMRAWIDTMISAIRGQSYFRIHDSGDMFSPAYALAWLEVCTALPDTRFWIPTRAYQSPHSVLPVLDPVMLALRKLATLPNVTVRPSALNFGDHAPVVQGLHAGSTAGMPDVMRARECPAHTQGNKCGDCRACWIARDTPISYQKH